MRPDNIPSPILKEFAHVFAEPVTTIFNSSLVSGLIPSLWKDSYIIPIASDVQVNVIHVNVRRLWSVYRDYRRSSTSFDHWRKVYWTGWVSQNSWPYFQSNLKWNTFIEGMISKASKRLHIIRVLKRNGVSVTDLKHIYTALIRSVLEYCAPVWHTQIPTFLSDELKKVQRRALRILHPNKHYSEALTLIVNWLSIIKRQAC